ncbi:thioesterase family protein [Alteromonas sp. ASW11-19]|uniref:Thioesterase family protein n=1 Tax=Alteromonas salexigens TaxID=2982530 RepID=A0ABT2VNU2_9ALTE|nr:thioesterase family protein [Alteromonas salexigens]MCU7553916.1 thioesterase family protein [Alteromonas salexigens]
MHADQLFLLPEPQQSDDNTWLFENLVIPADWGQGRTAFGGITAGLVFQAIGSQVETGRLLRSFTTNFVGPLTLDAPFSVQVSRLREGKNVSQLTGQIIQHDRVCVFCQACFGQARKSKIRVENTEQHQLEAPAKANFIPQIPKVTPRFLRHFELSVDKGGLPFTWKKDSVYEGFMRFKEAPEVITDAHVITLIDAWPPTLLQMMKLPAPASTVSWNIEFIHPHHEVSPDAWFAYKAHTRQAADGYGHTEATIWNSHGDVIALSRQTVAVFD